MAEEELSALDEAERQLANARRVLASIKEVNKRDKVLNEHVLHSETVAEKLVEKLEKGVAGLQTGCSGS